MSSSFENEAQFRFYEELNDFLPAGKKKRLFTYHFNGKPSVKDAIEAIGIPHTEVDLIIANGRSVGFNYHLKKGDRISAYPVFEGIDISPIVKLRDKPLRESRFVCDVHLGKCARTLRLLGFDTLYQNDYDDPKIIAISVTQKRILLTRDQKLLHAKVITHGYWIRSQNPNKQVKEVVKRFDLYSQIKPFARCTVCNGMMKEVKKEEVVEQLKPKTKKYYNEYYQCESCKKVYWKGSHYTRMKSTIEQFSKS
jgi:hypothetical protein